MQRYEELKEGLLLEHEGRFVVIHADEPYDVFDTYEDALHAGYQRHGMKPFLVRQVLRVSPVMNFSRFSLIPCLA